MPFKLGPSPSLESLAARMAPGLGQALPRGHQSRALQPLASAVLNGGESGTEPPLLHSLSSFYSPLLLNKEGPKRLTLNQQIAGLQTGLMPTLNLPPRPPIVPFGDNPPFSSLFSPTRQPQKSPPSNPWVRLVPWSWIWLWVLWRIPLFPFSLWPPGGAFSLLGIRAQDPLPKWVEQLLPLPSRPSCPSILPPLPPLEPFLELTWSLFQGCRNLQHVETLGAERRSRMGPSRFRRAFCASEMPRLGVGLALAAALGCTCLFFALGRTHSPDLCPVPTGVALSFSLSSHPWSPFSRWKTRPLPQPCLCCPLPLPGVFPGCY